MDGRIVIATRGSLLARWQANHVADRLRAEHLGLEVVLNVIATRGDLKLDVSISKIGDKGVFTAELEASLRDRTSDIAVHSMKDLPTDLPEELGIVAVLERENPADLLLIRRDLLENGAVYGASDAPLEVLPDNGILGTSSLRRKALSLAARPDLEVRELRGNVDTRVSKLAKGQYDGVVLAAAGLIRLGYWNAEASAMKQGAPYWDELSGYATNCADWLPAACQGAVAIEARVGDARVAQLLAPLDHRATRLACGAERAFLGAVGGGCRVPVGAFGKLVASGKVALSGAIIAPDGSRELRGEAETSDVDGFAAARRMAESLLRSGGREILAACRDESSVA